MADKKLKNKYFVKNTANGSFTDVTTLFDGVRILAVSGFNERGKALNVFVQQWQNGATDFMITGDSNVIIRENVDIKITFVVSQRYADNLIDTQTVHDAFVNYMLNTDVWVASKYTNKQVHCVADEKYEPQTVKLHRGENSYIMGELLMLTLEKPTVYPAT